MKNSLTWKNIVGYGLGDVANNFAFAMGAMFLLNYYTDTVGINAAVAGTMLLLVRIFDAVADVVVGRVVDSTQTRWGKFRPFILFGAVPLMVFSVLVFSVPAALSDGHKIFYIYLTYMGLGLAYSLVNIPYGSLSTAMTQHPEERAKLGAARTIMASFTYTLLAFVIAPAINSRHGDSQSIYTLYTCVLAVVGVALYWICFRTTQENITRVVQQPTLRISLKTIKRNRPLIILCLVAIATLTGTFSLSAAALYYVRYILHDMSYFSVLIFIQTFLGAVLAAPLVPRLVKRYGKKSTFILGSGIAALGYLTLFFFLSSSVYVAFFLFACASFGASLCMTVMWALEADTVEYGEYQTGVRIEGLTYSLFSFTRKCGQAIGGSLPAFILVGFGYVSNQPQSAEAITGIKLAVALIPAFFMFLAFIGMCCYPLTEKKYQEIVQEIEKRKTTSQQFLETLEEHKVYRSKTE
ncbi:glucuronide transporter [Erwiniaceae bacterium BAC15a-03b]|uniref:Glucuronide transporter n=1 Tax=Winslowiella arboricola TaxID=2978220 RepID=A0A9J6PJ03_9GAMM|nr:glucuronide transporter [Winslowiella arboricola]MCU5771646.1 glucuronide transporter [Winslowiella arboricola]MCU5776459.1 glucuronide transporter [Winslowiella arboricola]